MVYQENCDAGSKSWFADENASALRDLMKELKLNLTESQELQVLYYNKLVKQRIYRLGYSTWLSDKHIKSKKNLKLEHKYHGLFEKLKTVGKQTDKLKLPAKWL